MGTLDCINDMLRRDKENRELRKLNRERMREQHKFLVEKGGDVDLSNISLEKIEEIRRNTIEKEESDKNHRSKVLMALAVCLLSLSLLSLLLYHVFS